MGNFISNIFGSGSGDSYSGFGPQSFGGVLPALASVTGTINPNPSRSGVAVSSDDSSPGWLNIMQTFVGDGLAAYKTYSAADLASQQIKAGQPVTVIGQNGQMSGTANISPYSVSANLGGGTLWLIIAIAAVLLVVFMRN